jgi:pimeloyl-ACP methyl ester carboxylesterase
MFNHSSGSPALRMPSITIGRADPTWGVLYRDFVEPLRRGGYRVVIPDMIGFGLSEKPTREEAHSLDAHIANLTALLRQLDLRGQPLSVTTGVGRRDLASLFRTPIV